MAVVSAFKDGSDALRANPVLLVAGLFVGIGSQLQYVAHLIDSPILSAGVSLAWVVVFPFVLGGFIGTARAAIDGKDASLAGFFAAAWTHYRPLFAGTVAFVMLVFGIAVGLGLAGFVFGLGAMALATVSEAAAFAVAVGSTAIWLLSILVAVMFVQFYDTAIVIEDKGVAESLRRSVELVRSNIRSVAGFSAVWVVLLNALYIPEYLLRVTLTDASPADGVPIAPGLSVAVLLPIGIVLSAIGFAYLYTVYTAYYVRLTATSPAPTEPI
jgi:hypothetical protein